MSRINNNNNKNNSIIVLNRTNDNDWVIGTWNLRYIEHIHLSFRKTCDSFINNYLS